MASAKPQGVLRALVLGWRIGAFAGETGKNAVLL
jgi:hypothetical protein